MIGFKFNWKLRRGVPSVLQSLWTGQYKDKLSYLMTIGYCGTSLWL